MKIKVGQSFLCVEKFPKFAASKFEVLIIKNRQNHYGSN